jgi:hypothetical protein
LFRQTQYSACNLVLYFKIFYVLVCKDVLEMNIRSLQSDKTTYGVIFKSFSSHINNVFLIHFLLIWKKLSTWHVHSSYTCYNNNNNNILFRQIKHIHIKHTYTITIYLKISYKKSDNRFILLLWIRIRIFIIPINGPTIGANKLHTLMIVIGGNYT